MNATKVGLSLLLFLTLASCALGPLGYGPGECNESCDTQHMGCQRGGRLRDGEGRRDRRHHGDLLHYFVRYL